MKKKKLEKKKRRRVRERDWERHQDESFTHDLKKHRRAQLSLPEKAQDASAPPMEFTPNALVISHAKKWAFVFMEGRERLCKIDEHLKEGEATLLAAGDQVFVEFEGEHPVVRGLAPRHTKLSRLAGPHARVKEQVFAANVDVLLIVTAVADPPFRSGLVDRYLIAAQTGGVEPILCVNKMDLVPGEPEDVQVYRELGLRVFCTSCKSGEGMEALREALSQRLTVLSGHSGVGKSTLLNTLDRNLEVFTQEISGHTHRGRHTTTASRLYMLRGDTRIIDTPGIRALGLWEVSPEQLAFYFPELATAAANCQFRNCTHTHEPGCEVKQGVQAGDIPRSRFESYLRIRASLESDSGTTPGRLAPMRPSGPEWR